LYVLYNTLECFTRALLQKLYGIALSLYRALTVELKMHKDEPNWQSVKDSSYNVLIAF